MEMDIQKDARALLSRIAAYRQGELDDALYDGGDGLTYAESIVADAEKLARRVTYVPPTRQQVEVLESLLRTLYAVNASDAFDNAADEKANAVSAGWAHSGEGTPYFHIECALLRALTDLYGTEAAVDIRNACSENGESVLWNIECHFGIQH